MIRKLAIIALGIAFIVIVLGAYVRLSDAGLGCPDWPGCYGQLTPHHAQDEILAAHAQDANGPVSLPKAWKEMIHRYIASSLGLFILAIAFLTIQRWRTQRQRRALGASVFAVALVIFQGMLGMWTVTLLLKPVIVSLHLLGGLAVLATLAWIVLSESHISRYAAGPALTAAARLALILLVLQIALGGWVSTNYAALACPDFPTCQNSFMPPMDFANAFHMLRELGRTNSGEILPAAALTAIHWLHRLGAIIVGGYLLTFAWRLARHEVLRGLAYSLGCLVCLQIGLGISNVVFALPLSVAVAHNGIAALLLLLLISLNYRLRPISAGAHMQRLWHD